MDFSWATVLPVVGLILTGGGIAAIAGFVGAHLESRREQKRWMRDRRLDAYTDFLAKAGPVAYGASAHRLTHEQGEAIFVTVSALGLVGPRDVFDAGKDVLQAVSDVMQEKPDAMTTFQQEMNSFEAEARHALGFPPE